MQKRMVVMQKKQLVKQILLAGSGYWVLNKRLVELYGLEPAFLLSNMAEAEQMLSDKDGWFYQTGDTLETLTGLSRYKQDRAIEMFEENGILKREVRGIPAKRYFKFDHEALVSQFVNNLETSIEEIPKQELKEFETSKELKDKEHKDKEHKEKSTSRKFTFDDNHFKLAKRLWLHIKKNFPKAKEPNLESWSNDIRLMMEQDGRSEIEIKGAIDWSQANDFWYANIRSASKLRSQYETLYAQADRDGKSFDKSDSDWKDFDFLS